VKWIVSPVKTPKLDLIGCFFLLQSKNGENHDLYNKTAKDYLESIHVYSHPLKQWSGGPQPVKIDSDQWLLPNFFNRIYINILILKFSGQGLYQKSVYFRHKSLSQGGSVLMYKFTFFPRIIAQWNLLPVAAVQCTTLDSFWEKIPQKLIPFFFCFYILYILG
jgi:hypothetical protein